MNLAEQEINELFRQIKVRFDKRNRSDLVCKQGIYTNCCVLKLQKAAWTNDPIHEIRSHSGIFFSVWCDKASLQKNRMLYNIHALKLRELGGYAITSRDFAADFRTRFEAVRDRWPNVSIDYGPATLMQGWIGTEPDSVGKGVLSLMDRFERLTPMIDDLLRSRRVKTAG